MPQPTPAARVCRAVLPSLALVALIPFAGCKKQQEPAVEAVETGSKKPPVVGRKSKPAEAVAAPAAASPTAAEPMRRPPPAVAAPQPVTPTAAPVGAGRAIAAAERMAPGTAEPAAAAVPAPGAVPPPSRVPEAVPAPAAVPPPAPAEAAAATPPPVGRALGVPRPIDRPVAPPSDAEPTLDVNGYLSIADLEFVLGQKLKFRRSDLLGTQPSKSYNALYYAPQTGDQFGVSVQVWQDNAVADTRVRFNTMRNSWSNVAPTNRITEGGFRAHFEGVVTMVFVDPRRPLIAAVSCSSKLCTGDQLAQLAQRVLEHLR